MFTYLCKLKMLMLALLILVPVFFVILLKNSLFRPPNNLPPGPNTWQVLSNISEFRNKPHVAFANLAKIYGPIMSLNLGSQVVIIASTAATAREILKTQDRKFSGRYLPWVCYKVPSVQKSSVAMARECNETWKSLRVISQNFIFSSKSLELKAELRKGKVKEMVKYLRSKEGEVVKLDDIICSTGANIISNMLVSKNLFDIRGENEHDERVKALVDKLIESVSSLGLSDLFSIVKKVDIRSTLKGVEIYRQIMCIWEDMVKKRRVENIENSDRDFLDALIADNALSDDQICILFMELFIAGIDSPGITSVWLMVEFIRHPHILRKVREEIANAFQPGDILINETILTESQYFQACIKETLRFHIPGPFLMPHRAIETSKIDNYVIPKDSMVLVNAWAISLDPNSWKDATSFNPDRFLIHSSNSNLDFKGTHFQFIPFGSGRRMCPGMNMGLKNVQLLVASLLHYFDWTLPNPTATIDTSEKFGTVLKKETPLCLIPKMREEDIYI